MIGVTMICNTMLPALGPAAASNPFEGANPETRKTMLQIATMISAMM